MCYAMLHQIKNLHAPPNPKNIGPVETSYTDLFEQHLHQEAPGKKCLTITLNKSTIVEQVQCTPSSAFAALLSQYLEALGCNNWETSA